MNKIIINKNRGWRGLAEVIITNEDMETIKSSMIFSFSEQVWRDMLKGIIVTQDKDYYYVHKFNGLDRLPKPTQQRSVLITNFIADIEDTHKYPKDHLDTAELHDLRAIANFKANKNNHTKSDWNCIGLRVVPMI